MKDIVSDDEPSTYQERVIHSALGAVVDAGSIAGEPGGYVELDAAIDGLCDAIAALEAGAGVSKSPAERRRTADRCRQRIIATGSGLARMAAGEPLRWQLTAIPQSNSLLASQHTCRHPTGY